MHSAKRLAWWGGLLLAGTLSACGGADSGLTLPDTTALATALTIPAPPRSVDNVSLSWPAVAGARSYVVYRCAVPAGVTQDLVASASVENCGAPIAVTPVPSLTDVPPLKAPQAYVYHLRACTDLAGQVCGPVIGSVVAALAVATERPLMRAVIGDEGRQTIAGMTTTLHAFPDGATGTVAWSWTQESGPKVTLVGANTPSLSFTAPNVTTNTILSFGLRASDQNGSALPAKVTVTVVPADNVIVKAAGSARLVQGGHQVSLHAQGDRDGLLYAWRQVTPAPATVAIAGADTANPSFTAPLLPEGGVLRFAVTATDPVTGRNATALTGVEVQRPPLSPIPTQQLSPVLVPQLRPLQVAQPLLAPAVSVAVPVPSPVLAPPQVPPQALHLLAQPAVVATGGTSVRLTALASGGTLPYTWSWAQTAGPAASLNDASQSVPTVQLPVVDATQTLAFRATLTDAAGKVQTAQALVLATPAPQPAGNSVPAPKPTASLSPQLAVPNVPQPILNIPPLTDLSVVQLTGPLMQATVLSTASGSTATGGGSTVTVIAPLIKDSSAQAILAISGTDAKGQTLTYIVPVQIVRTPDLSPPPTEPLLATVLQPLLQVRQLLSLQVVTVNVPQALSLNVSPLADLRIEQISGPRVQVTTSGGAVTVNAPLITDLSAPATLALSGKDANGQVLTYIAPLLIVRPPALAPAVVPPPMATNLQPVLWPPPGTPTPTPAMKPYLTPQANDPLVFSAGTTTFSVDEGASRDVSVLAVGGRGAASYTYQWSYVKAPGGPDIVLSNAATMVVRFTAPAVDHATDLHFRVRVSDGDQTIERDVLGRIEDLAPTLVVGALTPVSARTGAVVTLHNPMPTGGLPFADPSRPYEFTIRQVSGPTVAVAAAAGGAGNWRFATPPMSAGDADLALDFELSATDRLGNVVTVSQQVTVSAPPPAAALVAQITAPANLLYEDTVNQVGLPLTTQGAVTGGRPPYTLIWQVTPRIRIDASTVQAATTKTALDINPSFILDKASNPTGRGASYSVDVKLTVTDAAGKQVSTTVDPPIRVVLPRYFPGSEVVVCGDLTMTDPCSDLDLVLAITATCPDNKPFGMNSIYTGGDGKVTEYRSCVDVKTAWTDWLQATKTNSVCMSDVPQAMTGDAGSRKLPDTLPIRNLACHYACYGDLCNEDPVPPSNKLLFIGPDGQVTYNP